MKNTPLLLVVMALTPHAPGGDPVATTTGTDQTGGCTGTCGGSTTSLTVADVQQVIAQAVAEAQARSVSATIAVVDRVGNVLAVYRMGAAATRSVTITTSPSGATVSGGLEGISLPSASAAGEYRSRGGDREGGHRRLSLFGRQRLLLADCEPDRAGAFQSARRVSAGRPAVRRAVQPACMLRPDAQLQWRRVRASARSARRWDCRRTRAASLYIRVAPSSAASACWPTGSTRSTRTSPTTTPTSTRRSRYAATFNFAAPVDRRGDRITADGKTLRFSDVDFNQLRSNPASAPAFSSLAGSVGIIDCGAWLLRRRDQRGHDVRSGCFGHSCGWRHRLSRPRRVRAGGCRERFALSAACGNRWRARWWRSADAERSAHGSAGGARCRESCSRADSPAAGLAGARDHLGRRYARRDSRASRARAMRPCSALTFRCRRRAPPRSCRRPRPPHSSRVAGRKVSQRRAPPPSVSRVRSASAAT